jgi:GNAT superfamily N-acetyltransferase
VAEVTLLPVAAGGPQLRAPEALTAEHDVSKFQCGEHPDLATWLQQRALKNEGKASRTYVLPLGNRVIGFYCISTASVATSVAPGGVKRNMPDPIPVLIMGRLAVDDEFRGRRYGEALLKEALLRCLQVSNMVGVRAVMLHAKDEKSANFYKKYKFVESPTNPLTFFLPIETIEQVFK